MSVDSSWKGVYKAAGISLIIAGVLFIIGLLAFSVLGSAATTGKELLQSLSGKDLFFRVAIGSFALATALFIPGILGLYLALKELGKTYALIASVTALVATAVSLTSIFVFYAAPTLSSDYYAATADAQKAAYIATADLLLSVVNASFIVTGLLFAAATILISILMLRGVFGKGVGYLGLIAGLVGIPGSLPAVAIIFLISTILFAVWFIAVGWKLYKLA